MGGVKLYSSKDMSGSAAAAGSAAAPAPSVRPPIGGAAPMGSHPLYPGFNPLAGLPAPTFQSHSLAHAQAAAAAAAEGKSESSVSAGPTKTVTLHMRVPVRCQVLYIDFEGRSDGKSIKKILSSVQPRKLILIHGSDTAKDHLKSYCEKNVCRDVYVPVSNQSVDITSETNIYRVALDERMVSGLDFVKLNDFDIAFADGEIQIDYKQSTLPILKSAPPARVKGHAAVFLGDLKFADLKRIINKAGISAEFAGGILVCANGTVNLRKVSQTQISIHGALCDEYFKIRSLLYGKFSIL